MIDPRPKRRGGRPKLDKPNPVDVYVGKRVRLRRTLLGMSQEKLGEALGLTFQQVQKYERGTNRIGASRLHELSTVLDVPVGFFYEDMEPKIDAATGLAENPQATFEADPLAKRETLELVRAYYKITDPLVRRRVFELTKALAYANEFPYEPEEEEAAKV